jgi:hypothetical protein
MSNADLVKLVPHEILAYKVFFRTSEKKLISGGALPKELIFEYKENEINVPTLPQSKFFVFYQKEYALDFWNGRDEKDFKRELWQVRVPDLSIVRVGPRVWAYQNNRLEQIQRFWKKGADSDISLLGISGGHLLQRGYGSLCKGAYLASSLIPEKQIRVR